MHFAPGINAGADEVTKKVDYAIKSERGLVRDKNEDSYACYVAEEGWPLAFIVADGMGGHSKGELASKVAADYCQERLSADLGKTEQAELLEALVLDTMQKANIEVYLKSLEDQANSGMGTTLTLTVFYPAACYLGHIGDSRCYIMRKGILEKISRDHTLVQEMQDAGTLTPEEGSTHPKRHILTQALGVPKYLSPEVLRLEIKKGDRFLLCSDGLHGYVAEDLIADCLRKAKSAEACADELVRLAIDAGGLDNVTVAVIFL